VIVPGLLRERCLVRKSLLTGVAVSAIFIWLFTRNVDWTAIERTLVRVHSQYLLPAVLIYLLALAVRAVRWRFLLGSVQRVPSRRLLSAVFIGFAANTLLPARSGELVRAYAAGRQVRLPTSTVLGSIVLERLFDGFTVLALLPLSLVFVHLPKQAGAQTLSAETLRGMGVLALAFFVCVTGFIALLQWNWRLAERLLRLCLRPLRPQLGDRIVEVAQSFAAGLKLSRGVDLAAAALLSVVVWGLGSASVMALFPGFEIPFSFWNGVFAQVVIALAVMIPAAPGFLGTFHAAVAAALLATGASAAAAKSFALVLWCVNFIPVTLIGVLLAWAYGLSWSSFGALRREPSPGLAPAGEAVHRH
jgi:uncharacterized protein (TIRG00374 family)